ncbi:MAG: hypothetical protein HYU66_16560, partial [Armatimonadetes bacterium]|nr:hypothetical protein [Armatimonadota bacterium]
MTGRERVQCAMAGREADRVPFMCQLAIGHYFLHLDVSPADFWLHNDAIVDSFVALAERYGMDGVLINLPGRDPDIDAQIERRETRDNGEEWIWFRGWPTPLVCPEANLPQHPPEPPATLADLDPDHLFYEDPHT